MADRVYCTIHYWPENDKGGVPNGLFNELFSRENVDIIAQGQSDVYDGCWYFNAYVPQENIPDLRGLEEVKGINEV